MPAYRVRSIVIGSISTLALLAMTVPGHAGELDDLKAQVELLMKRIEQLETKQKDQEAKQAAQSQKAATPNNDTPDNDSPDNDGVKLTVSGQVNRAALYADDGDSTRFFHVDNDNSSTRVSFKGKGKIDDEFSVGSQIEVQFESNSSADIDIDQEGEVSANNFTERKLELYLDSKTYGRLWLGQGDTASNNTSEVDESGTSVVAYSGIADLAGGLSFKNTATNAKIVKINGAFSQFDGLSRRDRLRYDTPKVHNFQASGSFVQGDAWDVALRYAAKYPAIGTKVSAAMAYADGGRRFDFDQVNGSISALHDSGVSLTFAAGTRDIDGRSTDDPVTYYGKLGYKFAPFSIGMTALSIDYGMTDDLAADGDEFSTLGVFAVQNIDDAATELYLGFRNHELDRPGISVDDINVGVAGARVKF